MNTRVRDCRSGTQRPGTALHADHLSAFPAAPPARP